MGQKEKGTIEKNPPCTLKHIVAIETEIFILKYWQIDIYRPVYMGQ